jgi:uncharacterized protein DUF2330
MRRRDRLGVAIVLGVAFGAALGERDAAACGGCIQPPPPPMQNVDTTLTAERMIFSISKTQTTLFDQINFSGTPSSFAWVLPIRGTVKVGLSADIFFDTIDQLTSTVVNAPIPCTYCLGGGGGGDAGGGGGDSGASDEEDSGAAVVVIGHAQVGPYETVQLASKDGSALSSWLAKNGYALPAADAPVIAAYVAAGMNFLAMKLVPGAGVQSMQPVRVTTDGAFPTLPLHMVSVGTGAITGITLWIVADGRWEPQNAPFFTIRGSDLTWDWATESSNYESVRLAKEKALGNAGWQIESSLEMNKTTISQNVYTNVDYASAGLLEDGGVGGYLAAPDGGLEGGMNGAAEDDLNVLFDGISGSNVRITRLRTDIAHSALSKDLVIQASADQGEMTNQITPTHQVNGGCPGDGGEGGEEVVDACGVGDDEEADGSPEDGGSGTGRESGGCNTTATASPSTEDLGAIGLALVLGVNAYRRRRQGRT